MKLLDSKILRKQRLKMKFKKESKKVLSRDRREIKDSSSKKSDKYPLLQGRATNIYLDKDEKLC